MYSSTWNWAVFDTLWQYSSMYSETSLYIHARPYCHRAGCCHCWKFCEKLKRSSELIFVFMNFVALTQGFNITKVCTKVWRFNAQSWVRGYHVYEDINLKGQCRGRTIWHKRAFVPDYLRLHHSRQEIPVLAVLFCLSLFWLQFLTLDRNTRDCLSSLFLCQFESLRGMIESGTCMNFLLGLDEST